MHRCQYSNIKKKKKKDGTKSSFIIIVLTDLSVLIIYLSICRHVLYFVSTLLSIIGILSISFSTNNACWAPLSFQGFSKGGEKEEENMCYILFTCSIEQTC